MIVYKLVGNSVKPVECEIMEYPKLDSEGDTIYKNSHFKTKQEAYNNVIKNCQAGVSILTRQIIAARENLRKLESLLADECIDLERLKRELENLNVD